MQAEPRSTNTDQVQVDTSADSVNVTPAGQSTSDEGVLASSSAADVGEETRPRTANSRFVRSERGGHILGVYGSRCGRGRGRGRGGAERGRGRRGGARGGGGRGGTRGRIQGGAARGRGRGRGARHILKHGWQACTNEQPNLPPFTGINEDKIVYNFLIPNLKSDM